MYDTLIRGGTLVDGTGAPPRIADIGLLDGRIVAIGQIDANARTVIDATGAIVTPGFVDIHDARGERTGVRAWFVDPPTGRRAQCGTWTAITSS